MREKELNDFLESDTYFVSESDDQYMADILKETMDEKAMFGNDVVFKPELLDGFINTQDKGV